MLRDWVLSILRAGAHEYGKCFEHEATKRRKIGERRGRLPGARSVSRVEYQLKREGLIGRRQLRPGEAMPPGFPFRRTNRGLVLVWLISRQQRRSAKRVAEKQQRARPPRMIGERGPERPPLPPVVRPDPPAREARVRRFERPDQDELERARAFLRALDPPGTPKR